VVARRVGVTVRIFVHVVVDNSICRVVRERTRMIYLCDLFLYEAVGLAIVWFGIYVSSVFKGPTS
jgi:hypothetical protein